MGNSPKKWPTKENHKKERKFESKQKKFPSLPVLNHFHTHYPRIFRISLASFYLAVVLRNE
jgi:hypothetical protein